MDTIFLPEKSVGREKTAPVSAVFLCFFAPENSGKFLARNDFRRFTHAPPFGGYRSLFIRFVF